MKRRERLVKAAKEAPIELPKKDVCRALGLSKATFYRHLQPPVAQQNDPPKSGSKNRPHPRALTPDERATVLELLHTDRFADAAPTAVYATLLDEGIYLCSIRTMYRILHKNNEVRERRPQAKHPPRTPPQLVARGPNEVWTWDITHLQTTIRGQTLKLYVCLDLYSRYVVGWYLSFTESAQEAAHFFRTLAQRAGIDPDQLVLHSDNGSPMRSATLAETLGGSRVPSQAFRPSFFPF